MIGWELITDLRLDSYRPQPIELAASDELVATDNIEVLRQNGFEIEVNEAAAEEYDHRLRLVAKPVSKTTQFDMKGRLKL